jgi:hypothetical protein
MSTTPASSSTAIDSSNNSSNASASTVLHPSPPGEDGILPFCRSSNRSLNQQQQQAEADDPPVVWHGSSMALIAQGTTLLNETFNEMDPEQDYEKWGKIGARPYFLAVLLQSSQVMSCCMRCLFHGDWNSNSTAGAISVSSTSANVCQKRVIVDYLVTLDECQGRGYAGYLLELVMTLAVAQEANCYVLALEDSCVYWMAKGFILEQDKAINQKLNVFPDAHLLKLPTKKPEDPKDFPLCVDESDDMNSQNDNEDNSDDDNEDDNVEQNWGDDNADDEDLQRAIMMSLGN